MKENVINSKIFSQFSSEKSCLLSLLLVAMAVENPLKKVLERRFGALNDKMVNWRNKFLFL